MNPRDLLEYILAVDDARLANLKASLVEVNPTFLEITTGDGTPFRDIYAIRAQVAKDHGIYIEGYEDLLTNLQEARDRRVVVLHVNTDRKAFQVFTDAESKRIFGVLSGDLKRGELENVVS